MGLEDPSIIIFAIQGLGFVRPELSQAAETLVSEVARDVGFK